MNKCRQQHRGKEKEKDAIFFFFFVSPTIIAVDSGELLLVWS
jgi:hypothetical protein